MATEGKSSKEVRSQLKKAKDCVTQSDYATALVHVDNALGLEQDNCNGLVMRGFILMKQGEVSGAEEGLWRAVQLQDGLLSAWQGLKELYEREGGTQTKKAKESLCQVYKRLLEFYTDESKKLTTVEKLANLQIRLDLKQEALYIYLSLFSLCTAQDKQQQIITYWHRVTEICIYKIPRIVTINEIFPKLRKFYENICKTAPNREVIFPYIELLYRIHFLSQEKTNDVINHSMDVISNLSQVDELPSEITSFSHEMVLVYFLTSDFSLNIDSCNFLFSHDNPLLSVLNLIRQEKFVESLGKLELFSEFQSSIVPGRYVKLCCLFETYQFPETLDSCYEELKWLKKNTSPSWFHIWYTNEVLILLINAYLEMGSVSATRDAFGELIGLDGEQKRRVDFLKAKLLVLEKNYEEAESILLALMLCEDNRDRFITKLVCMHSEILSQTGRHDESVELMKKELSSNATSHLCHFQLGTAYWLSGTEAREDKEKCLKSFLKAFSLDQLHYKPMLSIGRYYNTISINKGKSRKCLEKACQLAPWSNEVGQAYGDLLLDLGQEEDALDFYHFLSSKISPNTGKWVWLRLGLSERKVKNYPEAIRCFQNALNCDEQDPRVLECLGEVYLVRGSLKSALACFEAVLKLEAGNLFCQYQVGCIRRQAGELAEAVEMFEKVLELDASYVPALLGAADCHYQLSVQSVAQGLRPAAVLHVERGIGLASKCAELRSDYSSVWYCIGEIGMLGRHFSAHTKFQVSSHLFEDILDTDAPCGPAELLKLSIKAFHRCAELSPHHSILLYNLSRAHYYAHSQGRAEGTEGGVEGTEGGAEGTEGGAEGTEGGAEGTEGGAEGTEGGAEGTEGGAEGTEGGAEGTEGGAEGTEGGAEGTEGGAEGTEGGAEGTEGGAEGTEGGEEEGNIDLAYKYCVNAIILMERDPNAWNLLGLILLSKEQRQSPLIQHCFIKSLSLQSSHVTWTNLGYFYLAEDKPQLALKCFENARSSEPLALGPWMGLAFVYHKFDRQRESLGLLRHLNSMGYSAEGALWFGWRVCEDIVTSSYSAVYNEDGEVKPEVLVSVLLARDRLLHYSLHHPLNPTALNLLGVLYELEGIYTLSANALSDALLLIERESEEFSKVVTNLVRVRNKSGRADCERELLLSLPNSPTNLLQQAVGLFNCKEFSESIARLNELAKFVESEEDRNDVKIMVGLAANLARDQRLAKGTLAVLSKAKFPLHACAALCCIGCVYGDGKMLEGAVGQMHELCCGDWGAPPCYNMQQVTLVIASLLSRYRYEKGKGELVNKLEDLVAQLSTQESELSHQKFGLLAELEKGSLPVCMPTQIKHISSFIEPIPPPHSDSEEEMVITQESAKVQVEETNEKSVHVTTMLSLLRRAQKLIHSNPDDVTNWVSLILAVANQVWLSPERQNESPYLFVLVKLLLNLVDRTKEGTALNDWCIQTIIPLSFHSLSFGTTYLTDFPTEILNHPLNPVYSALASLSGNPDTQIVESCKNIFQTQIAMARYLVSKNNYIPAFNAYKTTLQIGKTISIHYTVFALLDMGISAICWYKRYVREKEKFPQELNLHKIAKDNLSKSKQLFPEISQIADALLKANEKFHDEFYCIEK